MRNRKLCAHNRFQDCDVKMDYFLPRFAAVLADPESAWEDWQDEYTQVVGSWGVGMGVSVSVFHGAASPYFRCLL